ncbi:ABC transporter substrate-binding protein [Paenibacillus sp. strain BS8-2]
MFDRSTMIGKFLLLLMCLMLFVVAGCSGNDDTKNAQEDSGGTSASETSKGSDSDETVTLEVWTWEKAEPDDYAINEFNKMYPNIKIEHNVIGSKEIPVRLQTALASGSDLPDIIWLEMGVRGKLLSLDVWDDLTKPPYNIDVSQLFDFMIPLGSNEKGEFVALDGGPSMAGLGYKRGLAKEFFGTDDNKDLESILPTWDAFIERGIEIKEKSDGKIFMLPSLSDAMVMLKGQNNAPFYMENRLNLKESLGTSFELLIRMKEAGIVDTIISGTPAHSASISQQNHVFMPLPDWGPTWIIKPNDPESKNQWGIMVPPEGGFPWGGAAWAVPKLAKNKEAAAIYLNWMMFSEEGATVRRDGKGYTSPLKRLYEPEVNFYSKEEPQFGGQDVMKYFGSDIVVTQKPARPVTEHDKEFQDAINLAVNALNNSKSTLTVDEMLDIVSKDILTKIPDLIAE